MAAERRTLVIEHDTSGFLRGDTKSRMEAYSLAINSGIMTQNEARIRENLNPVPGGDVLRYPLNMAEVGTDSLRSDPFLIGTERRSAEDAIAALKFTGVNEGQYKKLLNALEDWYNAQVDVVLNIAQNVLNKRSAIDKMKLIEAVKSYYRKVLGQMPDDMREAIGGIAKSAFDAVQADLGALAPPEDWFKRKLGYYFGDAASRLQRGFSDDVERLVNAAIGDDENLATELDKKLRRKVRAQIFGAAQTEAAMARNGIIVKSYHKAGYHAVWRSSPNCCLPCKKLDGVVVSTLTPPLHKGCVCTVKRGQRISASETTNPLDFATKYAKLKAKQEELGVYGALNYPPVPLEFSMDDYQMTHDEKHLSRNLIHNVTLNEAKKYVDTALFSIKRHYGNTQWYYTCYYSEDGATYVTDGHPVFRTAYHRYEFNKNSTEELVKEAIDIVKSS